MDGGAAVGGAGAESGAQQGAQSQGGAQGGQQGGQQPWYGGLDSETQGWMQSKGWATPAGQPAPELATILPEMVKAHRGLEGMMGRDKVVWPKDQADTAAWAEIHKRMGVPPKPEDYGLMPMGADGKPDEKAPRDFANHMQAIFHKLGIGKEAAVGVAQAYSEFSLKAAEAQRVAFERDSEQQMTALQREWGGQSDSNFAAAQRAQISAEGKGIIDKSDLGKIERAIGTTKMLKLMSHFGGGISEDRGAGSGGGGGFMTPEAASARLAELRTDQEWTKRYFAGDRVAVAEYNRLIAAVASRG